MNPISNILSLPFQYIISEYNLIELMKKSFTSTVRTNVSGLSNRTEAVLEDVAAKSLSQCSLY